MCIYRSCWLGDFEAPECVCRVCTLFQVCQEGFGRLVAAGHLAQPYSFVLWIMVFDLSLTCQIMGRWRSSTLFSNSFIRSRSCYNSDVSNLLRWVAMMILLGELQFFLPTKSRLARWEAACHLLSMMTKRGDLHIVVLLQQPPKSRPNCRGKEETRLDTNRQETYIDECQDRTDE